MAALYAPAPAWLTLTSCLQKDGRPEKPFSTPSCRATGATALARLGAPTADELGYAKALRVSEIGGTTVVVLEQDAAAGAVSTVVLRASTDQLLDDLERAIDDGVNTYKVLSTATHIVPCYKQAKED